MNWTIHASKGTPMLTDCLMLAYKGKHTLWIIYLLLLFLFIFLNAG